MTTLVAPAARAGGRARDDRVVHDDRRPAAKLERLASCVQPAGAVVGADPGVVHLGRQFVAVDPRRAQHRCVHGENAAGCQGAHRQLELERHSEPLHDQRLQRHVQRGGDLDRDGHAAARHAQHDGVGRRLALQPSAQVATGLLAIGELHGIRLPRLAGFLTQRNCGNTGRRTLSGRRCRS